MTSIRTYDSEIRICSACGQPAFNEELQDGSPGDWWHFDEQGDGVYCRDYPLAGGEAIQVHWDRMSLDDLKELYPDTNPHRDHWGNSDGRS